MVVRDVEKVFINDFEVEVFVFSHSNLLHRVMMDQTAAMANLNSWKNLESQITVLSILCS